MAELILNPRHWVTVPEHLVLMLLLPWGAAWGAGWPDLLFAEPLLQFLLSCPSLRFPQCPPSKHFENQIFESWRQLPWMRFPGGHFHLHRFSEPFRGPSNPVTQRRACPLLLPLPSCHKSEQLLTHRLLLPLWLPTLTCHLQVFLLWIQTQYTMSFSLSNSPGTWHFLLLMLPWLPMTHQNLLALRVELPDHNGLTSLIFLAAVIQTF